MRVFNSLKLKRILVSLFIVMFLPLFSINSYAMSEEEFVVFMQDFEHSKPKLSDSFEELMQKSHDLSNLLELKVPQLDKAEQLRYTRQIQFYINECYIVYNYNTRNWCKTERYLNNRMDLLSAETISHSVCSASLNCCKIMNIMENSSLSSDGIIKSKEFLALTHMAELFEESNPSYIIIKLEMQKRWPLVYKMIYGNSESIPDELESHTLHDEVRDKFYVNPNDIFCPHALAIGIAPEVAGKSLEILRETSQLSENHLAETNISIENNHENQSDTSTATQEAGMSEGPPDIPVAKNDNNEVQTSSEDLEFEIIELPNENIFDIQLHTPEIHLDYSPEIHLDYSPEIHLDYSPEIHLDYSPYTQLLTPDIPLDLPGIPSQPPEPPNNYMVVPTIELSPLLLGEFEDIDFTEPIIIDGPNIQLQQQVEAPMEIDVQQIIAEVANEDRDIDCPICQEMIKDEIAARPAFCHCGSLYHRNCLEEWFRERIMCPICKTYYN